MIADLDAARRELREQGWCVVPDLLSASPPTRMREGEKPGIAAMVTQV